MTALALRTRGRPKRGESFADVVNLDEARSAWMNVRAQARRIHLSVVADRPDLALHSAGAIVTLADRRLRQLGGSDAA